MAGRTQAAWKGLLKLSLVAIPVRMIAATERGDKIELHLLHEKCRTRIQQHTHCPTCNLDIPRTETVKGWEHAKGQFVVLREEERKQIEAEASSVLTVTTVSTAPLDPMYVDGTLLLIPEPAGLAALETLRVAVGSRHLIGDVVIRGKALRVALRPAARGFVVFKLRAADQVRTFDDLDLPAAPAPAPGDLALAQQVLASLEGEFSHEDVRDEYTARLRALLLAKVEQGDTATVAAPVAATPALSSLTEALRASLAAVPSAKAVKVTAAPAAPRAVVPKRRRA